VIVGVLAGAPGSYAQEPAAPAAPATVQPAPPAATSPGTPPAPTPLVLFDPSERLTVDDPQPEVEPDEEPRRARTKRAPKPSSTALRSVPESGPEAAAGTGPDSALLDAIGGEPADVPSFFIDSLRVPLFLLPIYQAAGIQYGVRWEILAAINEIETDYGRNLAVSSAGARGWMQFMPATWKSHGVDANRDGRADPYNPVDAIFAAGRYLEAAGAQTDLRKALFAYNHAGWYVESVLRRAQLLAALPADLVSALSGLAQGRPPVLGEAIRLPAAAKTRTPTLDLRVRKDAAAVAVTDGEVVRIGRSARLGRFVQLRDVFGNTYTYGHLRRVEPRRPVLLRGAAGSTTQPPGAATARAIRRGAEPARAAQPARAARPARAAATASAPAAVRLAGPLADLDWHARALRPAHTRIAAPPRRATAPATAARDYDRALLGGVSSARVAYLPLREGSRVVAGTILGRAGRHTRARGAVRFEIRPAGREAARIDPRPIVAGWKLLRTSTGGAPGLGPDTQPSIGQILLLGERALGRLVLENRGIHLYACGRDDIRAGRVDRRVLATLQLLAMSGLSPTVSSLRCGHNRLTASGNVSEHSHGSAVDITAINGMPILGNQGAGSIAEQAIRRLLTLQGTMRPHQIISLMRFAGADNTLAMSDHADHIHVGFAPPRRGSLEARLFDGVLAPSAWRRLIDRLARIANPSVVAAPAADAVVRRPSQP
jgi:soluble lytic murein transglycosylase-like protein